MNMKIQKIQQNTIFKENSQTHENKPNKREFIDFIAQGIKNPRDVQDCVAVPRGIFKAYMFIMAGMALIGIGGALPQKMTKTKTALLIAGNVSNFISAIFFAKPFFIKGLSPTVKQEDYNK